MSEPILPVPVRRVLTDSLDDARLRSLWTKLVDARARRTPPPRRVWTAGLLAALVVALVVIVVQRSPRAAPLHLSDGHDIPAKLANGGKALLSFDDGSTIDVGAGAGLDLLESTPDLFATAIRGGAVEFDVTPGGPRSWRIECGPVIVEVVGTRFSVERATRFVRVAVSRGAVLVRGENVPDRVVRLGPGQAIVVPLTQSPADDIAPKAATAGNSTTDVVRDAPAVTARVSAGAPSGSAPPERAPAGSVAQFEEPNVATPPTSIDVGLAAADQLRREGRFSEAAAVLERALVEHGADPGAPLAEFSLGRLYLDSLGSAAPAKAHFARALARGLPSVIAEDAEARWVEASAREGDLAGAREGARRYHAHYPSGRHGSDVDRWAAGAP